MKIQFFESKRFRRQPFSHPFSRCTMLVIAALCFATAAGAQTTWNFSTAATLSKEGGFYYTLAKIKIGGTDFHLSHMGNGDFSNQAAGGNSNSASLKKDGSGGDFFEIRRADSLPFQFYGMWLKVTSMYSLPYYFPPYFNIKYFDQNNTEIIAETMESSTLVHTLTVTKNLKVRYVRINFNAVMTCFIDDLIVGPAQPSVATVSTSSINQFTASTALLGGNVTYDGDTTVTERGIVYNTAGAPTTADAKVQAGSGKGTFSQTVTGFSNGTMYYVRAYATNSAGTSYGSQQTFTTAAAFTLAQTHYFNTAWVSTTSQPNPFTKYVEGWNITATATGGNVSVSRIIGTTGISAVGEGVASARAQSSTTAENLTSMGVKASDNSLFELQSFKFKYLVKTAGSSFGTITVTGYRNGVAVTGATASLTGIAEATSASYGYSTFDLTANSNFGNIDEFRITASGPVNAARLASIDIDVLKVAASSVLPLRLVQLTGHTVNGKAQLQWKTAAEQNSASFQVEHSADGVLFTAVSTVTAAGNSAAENTYSFTHANIKAGANYYRLKIIDRDGKYSYSAVVKVLADGKSNLLAVYPNPVTGNDVTIETGTDNGAALNYSIYNNAGVKVKEGSIKQAVQKIPVSRLAKGNYIIRVSNGQAGKIVKQ